MALTASVNITVQASLTGDPVGSGSNVTLSMPFSYSLPLADGTAANQANRIYHKRLTLSTTPTDIDLAGSLVDALGNALVFVEVVAIAVKNNSTVAGQNVHVGGDAAALVGWVASPTDIVVIFPGGCQAIVNPNDPAYAVTGTTADILQLVAAAGTPTADVLVLGRSA